MISFGAKFKLFVSLVISALVVISAVLFWNYSLLKIRVAWANAEIQIFDEMCIKARQGDAKNAANCLEYVVNYYPSGARIPAGSPLDEMVKRDRSRAEQEIIGYLKVKTGQDLGSRADAWIKKLAEK